VGVVPRCVSGILRVVCCSFAISVVCLRVVVRVATGDGGICYAFVLVQICVARCRCDLLSGTLPNCSVRDLSCPSRVGAMTFSSVLSPPCCWNYLRSTLLRVVEHFVPVFMHCCV
jgi:hypothetical protein